MTAHRGSVLAMTCVLALAAFLVAWRRATRLSPHTIESRRWGGVSGPFLLLASIDLIVLLLGVVVVWLDAMQTP